MTGQKGERKSYEILLSCTQIRRVNIDARSAEEACKMLQRQTAGKVPRYTDVSSILIDEVWSDPSERGEEWMVASSAQLLENPTEVMMWNGKLISKHNIDELMKGRSWAPVKAKQ